MVSVAPIISQPVPQPIGEKRFLFRSLDWQRYQTLRETLNQERNVRFTFRVKSGLQVTFDVETALKESRFKSVITVACNPRHKVIVATK